jgi:pyridoxamine 5'-phosphate oxidase-like protein
MSRSADRLRSPCMNSHEMTQELEHPGARELLGSATLLRLAYDGSDGFPRAIPIGFYWTGSQIVICTATTAPKVKALSKRPNVALTIDAGDTPAEAKALLVRGLARVDIVDGVPDEYLAASAKALGADQLAEFERQVRTLYDQMARISVEPVWARFFDFGAGRMPAFLTKLVGAA